MSSLDYQYTPKTCRKRESIWKGQCRRIGHFPIWNWKHILGCFGAVNMEKSKKQILIFCAGACHNAFKGGCILKFSFNTFMENTKQQWDVFFEGTMKKDFNGERETGFYVKQHLKPSIEQSKSWRKLFPFCGDNVSWHHQQHTALLCNQPQKFTS